MRHPWEASRTRSPRARNQISRDVRGDIFDWLTTNRVFWGGRLTAPAFLSRRYRLQDLPSHDYRFHSAEADIRQHTVNYPEWDDDWVLDDERFELRDVPDAEFLRFLVETVHPAVRRRPEDAARIAEAYNASLTACGFEIVGERDSGDGWIYGYRATSERLHPEKTRLAEHPEVMDREVFQRKIKNIGRDIDSEPGMAIATCKNLFETLFKTVLQDRGVAFDDHAELPALFKLTSETLGIDAAGVPGDKRGSAAVKKALGAVMALVTSVAEIRNAIGEGHGGLEVSVAEPRHARLAFNATMTAGEFVLDSWRS